MAIDKFHPVRVNNTNEEDFNLLLTQWFNNGKPRRFVYSEVTWMQIENGDEGIVFIPTGNGDSFGSDYGRSSFEKVLR